MPHAVSGTSPLAAHTRSSCHIKHTHDLRPFCVCLSLTIDGDAGGTGTSYGLGKKASESKTRTPFIVVYGGDHGRVILTGKNVPPLLLGGGKTPPSYKTPALGTAPVVMSSSENRSSKNGLPHLCRRHGPQIRHPSKIGANRTQSNNRPYRLRHDDSTSGRAWMCNTSYDHDVVEAAGLVRRGSTGQPRSGGRKLLSSRLQAGKGLVEVQRNAPGDESDGGKRGSRIQRQDASQATTREVMSS